MFRLAYKNITARKSSIVIIAFIAFAIMLLIVTNAVFDSTEHGIEQTFIESFTGNIVIRPKARQPLSLFGDETPITGELTKIERLVPFSSIYELLQAKSDVSLMVPQLSCHVIAEHGTQRLPVCLFGVNGSDYLAAMSAIRLVRGQPYTVQKGCMLSTTLSEALSVDVGDELQCIVVDGISFRIRAVPVTAIYEYTIPNATLDRIALVDAETVRALLDVQSATESTAVVLSEEQEQLLQLDFDDDDVFFSEDTAAVFFDADAADAEQPLQPEQPAAENSTTWNFILCRLHDAKRAPALIKELNSTFKSMDWPCEAVNWRSAAGSTAQYLYLLRLILNIGILIILGAGLIVVNNTLVITILDRLREIGTMRALGASRRYICAECMTETLLLTCTAGVIGCVAGSALSALITNMQIHFNNDFLIQLFGSSTLMTRITVLSICKALLLSLFLGLVAWMYPVYSALEANPVQAMQGAK